MNIRAVPHRILPSAALCLAVLMATGCMSARSVQSDIRRHRMERLDAWRAEGKDGDDTARTLTGGLTLDESVLIALGASREVQIALLERERADARAVEAYGEALPRVDVAASYARQDRLPSFGNGGIGISGGTRDNYNLSGTITQPLWRGGAISAGVRAARLYDLYTDEQLRGTYQRVIFSVRRSYYDARLAWELLQAATQAVQVAEAHLEEVRRTQRVGAASAFDVLRAEVELKSLAAEQVQQHNRYNLAMTTLYNLIGASQQSTAVLTDILTYEPFQPPMADAVEAAFTQHPDILLDELSVRLQREALAAARSGYWPSIDAFFTYQYARPDPYNPLNVTWDDAWQTGVRLTFPLFEGFRTWARVRQEKLSVQQREIALNDTEQRVLLQVRQAILSLQDAARFVESQQASVDQATEALRLAELGFREGIRREIEVVDARRALTRARANYAQAVYDHRVARLFYEQSTGAIAPPVAVPQTAPEAPTGPVPAPAH